MSFQQGLSGLNASSKNLEIIGNNIANANTFGAKVARAEFADVYAASLNGAGSNAVGIGTRLATVAQQFTQGSINTTENPMDLAINGAGFFQMKTTDGQTVYSRNGQFKVDREGYIVNNAQNKLVGLPASGGASEALKLDTTKSVPAQATDRVTLEMNLDRAAEIKAPAIDFGDIDTYNHATSVTVYDESGYEVALTFYFKKIADDVTDPANPRGQWEVYATANGETLPTPGGPAAALTVLSFAPNGLDAQSLTPAITIPPLPISSGFTRQIDITTFDTADCTQFASPFGVTALEQTGYAAGQLTSIVVENDGTVTARYSNGKTQSAGQVELATFRNPQGLQPLGDNCWAATSASGAGAPGTPGSNGFGALQAGALEESNIDLTGELVAMITAQRIYQANAQTIKTQDQVMQTLVNLR